ncbi:MAG: response regulator transcription factor [Myxococcales bacterium]|nr:response regulator transcription factor [Myxococcales bacterium]MCB9668572.1 response regulator transcription factor [Alphaproteobacteria bacterium]MCB9690813.1 response regulator transcription factor [Alphaproteobacteria bacterium]
MADILLVDDDPHLREVVRYALAREGHALREAGDGEEALRAFEVAPPDLLVLDVLMPELDGLEVCRRIRKVSSVPILFLSSRSEEMDRVMGLDLGGDDYLTKPFSPRELVSRVRALLRRAGGESRAPTALLESGAIRVDPASHRAWAGEVELELTVTELRMLAALVKHPGRAFTRAALVELAYDGPHHVSDRTVDSHVRNLRAKLRDAGVDGRIQTVHGLGFRLS